MTELEQLIYDELKKDQQYVIDLRRYFHINAELPCQEFKTQLKIEEELDKIGVAHKRVAGTGVYAKITGEKGPDNGKCMVLRADIDALPVEEMNGAPYASINPGVMHACGHDAHGAALIGSCRYLNAHKDMFSGSIIFIWQPAEEIGWGGSHVCEEGVIDEGTRSFGVHLASRVPLGKIAISHGVNNASAELFRVKIHGKAAHVSQPERGVDAAYIAAQIVIAIQSIATRSTNPTKCLLVSIGTINAGTAYNVVAEEAVMEGTIRAFEPEIRNHAYARVNEICQSIGALYGAQVEVEWEGYSAPVINDKVCTDIAINMAKSLFGNDNVPPHVPGMGGDDMAEYLERVPGCYAFVGSGNPDKPNTCVAHHNCMFDIDEESIFNSTLLECCYTIEYLEGINEEA